MPASAMFASGARLSPVTTGRFLVETELAFVLKRDFDASQPIAGLADIWDIHVGLEIVRSRLADWGAVGVAAFIADSVGFHAFILGEKLPSDILVTGKLPPALLRKNGRLVAPSAPESDRADPFSALDYFLAQARANNLRLDAGTVVTTGNLIAPYFTEDGEAIEGLIDDFSAVCSIPSGTAR
jgi:2-keto-4-pentenoate hydratase